MKSLKSHALLSAIILISLCACDFITDSSSPIAAHKNLKIIIIRHAEKPIDGDNLSCQGLNRALALPKVLVTKFHNPSVIFVPSIKSDQSTKHGRMFQTITPFAVQYKHTINSQFQADDYKKIAKDVLVRENTVLLVWSHHEIKKLAKALGVKKAPDWADADFDGVWVITYENGKAQLSLQSQDLHPAMDCQH